MHSKEHPFSCGPECKVVNAGRLAHTEENSAPGWRRQHWNLELNETNVRKNGSPFFHCILSPVFASNNSFTKSGLHWVDDMSKAVGVKYEGAAVVVIARVDTQHGVV